MSSSVHDVSDVVLCCVQAMVGMGNSSVGEQDVHMAPVARDPHVSTPTPEPFVMSGDEALGMSLPAASSSHAQVCILHTLMMLGTLHVCTPSTAFSA